MQVFNYTAKDKNGELLKGSVEAENENSAAKMISSRDLVPIVVSGEQKSSLNFFNKVALKDKVIIARQLATMINAGLPIAQSLRTLEEQLQKPNLKKILESVASDVEGGSTLSKALGRFPDFFTSLDLTLISAGETSGTLDKTLARLADQLEKEQSLMRKVKGAFYYPTFVVVVVVVVTILLLTYVMPQMESLYQSFDAKLPWMTQLLIDMSHGMRKFGIVVLVVFLGVISFLMSAVKRPAGRRAWDSLKLNAYGVNELLKKVYMARFSRMLSTLIGSGVPLLDALQITSKAVGNVIYEQLILDAAKKVKNGVALSEPLKANPLFPVVVPQMIAVGEKTGELDNMLNNLADYFEEEVETTVKNLSGLLEPLIIVVVGGIICIILIAVMLPIYSMGKVV